MPTTVIVNDVRYRIESPITAAIIRWFIERPDAVQSDNGKFLIHYKGTSVTIEPSHVEHVEAKA